MQTSDKRINAILHWLNHTLNLELIHFEQASCDASFRRYFRVTHKQGQHIIMDAPPEKENTEAFICIAKLLKDAKVNTPEIYQKNTELGFLLLEDFGSSCFLDQLNSSNFSDLYLTAFDSLFTLQNDISITDCKLPYYNQALYEKELIIFETWFLKHSLNISLPENIKQELNHILISSALAQPQVCVHRDFHSRNLMVLTNNSPGVIDFQDAVIGPISYDLVSLLRDCYISWPEEKVIELMTLYFEKLTQAGLINCELTQFTQWFDLMGLQRHLKAIGIFSRLHLRDNKSHYLADIPRTLNYVSHVCHQYPELQSFNHFLTHSILPAYKNKQ